MFDLDRAVLAWRREFARERAFSPSDLDELEDHLRAGYSLELELSPGLTPARAFAHACENLGSASALSSEFTKVEGRWWRRLLRVAWLAYAVSFFLPVARYGITLGHLDLGAGGLPGIQAFLLALQSGPLGVASALTNLAMPLAIWRISEAGRGRIWLLALLFGACTVLNLSWVALEGPPSDLYPGYWLWLESFALTATALVLRGRELPSADSVEPMPAS